jgi:hypothetical protein
MKTGFDFSKVKKASKAKSLNDMYAGGGAGDGDMLYGDSPKENAVPKILNTYKSPESKKRFLRKTYGGAPDKKELAEINRMIDLNLRNKEKPNEYAKEWFSDFLRNVNQTQPESNEPEREMFQAIDRHGNEFMKLGRQPTEEEKNNGVGGIVSITAPELESPNLISGKPNYDMNVHYHPWSDTDPRAFEPSGIDGDVGFAGDFKNKTKNFIATSQGDISQYDELGRGAVMFDAVPPTAGRRYDDPLRNKFRIAKFDQNIFPSEFDNTRLADVSKTNPMSKEILNSLLEKLYMSK